MFGSSTPYNPGADFAAAEQGGPTVQANGPLIPVRSPSRKSEFTSSGGSANAAEHSIGGPHPAVVDHLDPASAANAIYSWTDAERAQFAQKVWYLGGIQSPNDIQGALGWWEQAVAQAAKFAAANNPMDPQDVLDYMLTGDPQAQKAREMRTRGGVITQKSRSINVASAADAKALIVQAFKAAVGREPTDAELRTYTNSLQSAMKANPSVTTTTQKVDQLTGQVVDTASTTTGGMDAAGAGQFVNDQIANDPQAAEYQAAAAYFPALMRALGPASGMLTGGG